MTNSYLRPTPTSTRPLLDELNKKTFLSIETYNMKKHFPPIVTWDKPRHNYIGTQSRYNITKY